jgi:LPS sulfotransferase NodH
VRKRRAPGERRRVFIVGAPRSGTTWLQRLLAAHPDIASPQELDLFSGYVKALHELWRRDLGPTEGHWRARRFKGLPALLTEVEFSKLVDEFVAGVHAKIAEQKPGATTILEKDPEYSECIGLVRSHVPDASFIHLIRDGRAVAQSIVSASRGWGRSWAPDSVATAALSWRTHLEGAREAHSAPGGYMEVRYETLLADGPRALSEVLEFCGTDATPADSEQLLQRFPAREPASDATGDASEDSLVWAGEVTARGTAVSEPAGFQGLGEPDRWRSEWSLHDRWAFNRVAGELLVELGYEPDRGWTEVPAHRDALYAVRAGTRGRGASLAKRVLARPRVAALARRVLAHADPDRRRRPS